MRRVGFEVRALGKTLRQKRNRVTLFEEMGLPKGLVAQLTAAGIHEPTPIQSHAIPHALNGKDVLGLAQTGTGKTFAFGAPLVTQLSEMTGRPDSKMVRGLILAPTRELAKQISDSIKLLVVNSPIKIGLVVGGVSIRPQIARAARGSDIIVATPGRLIDLLDRQALSLSDTRFLILDEADQMLDLGFIHSLRKIAGLLPKQRQTMLFSATMPKQMNELAASYLQSPVRVEVSPPGKAADKIDQSVHYVAKAEKMNLLIERLKTHEGDLALVFSRTKHGAEKMLKTLHKSGFSAGSVHGNKSQSQRDRAIRDFREGVIKVLVATDVAARGLDIPDVRFVYNYDLPDVPENYVHRIGRTARAGAEGQAVAFCAPDEMDALKAIQKLMALRIPIGSGRPWEDIEIPAGKKNGARPNGNRRRKPSGSNPQGGHSAKPSTTGAQRARQRRKSKAARSAA